MTAKTTTTTTTEYARRPSAWQLAVLRFWHAIFAGGFAVAYVTADDDTYGLHLFSGSIVLLTVLLRVLVGLMVPASSPLAIPQAPPAPNSGRNPLYPLIAAAVIGAMGLAAFTGWFADGVHAAEDLHEGISQFAGALVLAHVAIVVMVSQGRRLTGRL